MTAGHWARLVAAGALLLPLAGRSMPSDALSTAERLVDFLEGNARRITVHRGRLPVLRAVNIGGDQRSSLVAQVPAAYGFRVRVPAQASLRFAMAVRPPRSPVRLRILRRAADGETTLHEEHWRRERGWAERQVDLSHLAGQVVELVFSLEGPAKAATVSVAHPELVGRIEEQPRPNVLLYVVDCLRADHVGAYGYARPTTPEMDRLASEGIVFERAYACAAWTKPSTGCLFTSLYPVDHGARTIDNVLNPEPATLAEILRLGGYATRAWAANPVVYAPSFGLARGFDRVVAVGNPSLQAIVNQIPADAAELTAGVTGWLEQNRDRRFFLYLHSLDLHYEYRPRPPFDQLFLSSARQAVDGLIDLYDNELAYNDRELGKVLNTLKRLNLYDRTLIVVTSDHGEEFGEHGFFRHGHTLFEPALHIPWILKLPGSRHGGRRIAAPASNLDIAPTVLDYSGLVVPRGLEGLVWRPFVEEGREPPPRRIYTEQLSPKEVLYAVRDARFKYIYRLIPQPTELLFDLERDPEEQRSLSPPFPAPAQALVGDLLGYLASGEGGYHVSVAGASSESWVDVEAWAEAAFTDVKRFPVALEEELRVAPDRKRVHYRFRAGDLRRHLVLRTDSPGEPVRFRLASGGRPLRASEVWLGRSAEHPRGMPFTAGPERLAVSLAEAAELLKEAGAPARLWYLAPPAARAKAAIDPELAQKLRALGYIQ